MTEIWKPVYGYEDCYEVSSHGDLRRSVNRYGNLSGRMCRSVLTRGYPRYTLSLNNETRSISAHRLVWEAFKGPIPHPLQVNHKNGIKTDNRLENLEIVTPSENTRHAFRELGREAVKNPRPGSKNGRARLSEEDVVKIKKRLASGDPATDIARDYSVCHATIWHIAKGNTWRHLA